MYIVLAGEVAIYKLRDQEEVMLEEQYHSAATKIIIDVLSEHMTTYGYASKDLIDSYMDDALKAKFKSLENIKSSRLA